MHENIRRFYLEGEVQYDKLTQARETLERAIEDNMREEGYVPVLDMEPQLTQTMSGGNFKILISIYGAFIGREEACHVAGLMNGKTIMRSTPSPKLKAS